MEILRFTEWLALDEMAARRSFNRSVGKFKPQAIVKPVAILTAFQGGTVRDTSGRKITNPVAQLSYNRKRNAELAADLKRLNLGFYPVKGAGQEERRRLFGLLRYIVPSSEESFVVQPIGNMPEETFVSVIQGLLQRYNQFAVMVKLPSTPQAFLLHRDGSRENKGASAGPTTAQDDYYTQLKGGPRADPRMLRPWEIHGERNPVKRSINWLGGRSFMNKPADLTKIGQRFTIKNPSQQRQDESKEV